jgi:hypothetical protein
VSKGRENMADPKKQEERKSAAVYFARGIHEAAMEEQRLLGREQDHDVDPDRYARWKHDSHAEEAEGEEDKGEG